MMTITYEVGDGLYVNLTNRCPNACTFCIRRNGAGAYGSDSLWLDREPTEEEVVADIEKRNPERYSELVFCGYGEPTERLDTLLSVARRIKVSHPAVKIRVNTNGLSDLIAGEPTAARFAGAVDTLSVSMNAATAEKYQEVCRSRFGLQAYPAMLRFCSEAKHYVPHVVLTVVHGTIPEDELAVCRENAERAGVSFRVREYIAPQE